MLRSDVARKRDIAVSDRFQQSDMLTVGRLNAARDYESGMPKKTQCIHNRIERLQQIAIVRSVVDCAMQIRIDNDQPIWIVLRRGFHLSYLKKILNLDLGCMLRRKACSRHLKRFTHRIEFDQLLRIEISDDCAIPGTYDQQAFRYNPMECFTHRSSADPQPLRHIAFAQMEARLKGSIRDRSA